jgi:hypothetical protein
MRSRLYLSSRANYTKGKTKETWQELLQEKENKIMNLVNDPYKKVAKVMREKALITQTSNK